MTTREIELTTALSLLVASISGIATALRWPGIALDPVKLADSLSEYADEALAVLDKKEDA